MVLQSFLCPSVKDFIISWFEEYHYSFLNQLFVVSFICCRKWRLWEYFGNLGIITNISIFNIDTIKGRTKSSLLYDTVSAVKEYGIQFLSPVRSVSGCLFFLYFFMVYRLPCWTGTWAQLQLFHVYKESPLSSPLIYPKGFRFTSSFKLMLQPTCLTVSLQLGCETCLFLTMVRM